MIQQYDIESKDFSISLPLLINKLDLMALLVGGWKADNVLFSDGDYQSLAAFLDDITDDLWVINEALHGSNKKASEETPKQDTPEA